MVGLVTPLPVSESAYRRPEIVAEEETLSTTIQETITGKITAETSPQLQRLLHKQPPKLKNLKG